ncbi:MAG: hypothetical protein ABI230_06780 [Aestuariivirga sp.]
MSKFKFITVIAAFGLAAISQNAWSADLPAVANNGCEVFGNVEASGLYKNFNNPNAPSTGFTSGEANGYAGAGLGCGIWNFQVTGGLQNTFSYNQNYGAFGYNRTDVYGYGGADVFVRDPNTYAFGVGVVRQSEDFHSVGYGTAGGQDLHSYRNFTQGHAFGEAYLNNITLGASGFYRGGDEFYTGNGFDSQASEYGGNVFGHYYVTPNVRVGLNGGLSQGTYQRASYTDNYSYYSATLTGAYKFEGSPVSVYGGLRYGGTNSAPSNTAVVTPSNYQDAYVGIRLDLGAHANGSLIETDRNGLH